MEVSQATQEAGAALFGVDPASLQTLNGTDGAVYRCTRAGRAHILKFVPLAPQQQGKLDEKLAFMRFLAGEGVRLAVPIPSENGALYEWIEVEGQPHIVFLSEQAQGEHIGPSHPDWGPAYYQAWGRAIGQMHAAATRYPLWQDLRTQAEVDAIPDPALDGQMGDWRVERRFFAGWSREPEVVAAWEDLHEQIAALPIRRDSYGLIHNDLHPNNFLYDSGQITVIDFDVCAYNWFIMDIGIALHAELYNCEDRTPQGRLAFARRFLAPFRRGYESAYALDGFWWDQLAPFLMHREILLYIVFQETWPPDFLEKQSPFLERVRAGIVARRPVLPENPVG